jgi:hypothetical protein
MQVTDLVRTSTSPEPSAGSIPYYTQVVGLNWNRRLNATTLGATVGFHQHHFDQSERNGWTLDIGARYAMGDLLRFAAATHLLGATGTATAHDVYGGVGLRVWRAPQNPGSRRRPSTMELRYGIAFGHDSAVDHMVGVGLDMNVLALDFMLAREAGFTEDGWRPIGGIRIELGKYRLTVARDAGLGEVGSAYRVGLEVGHHD